jgi:uncharacterized protein
MATTKVGVVFHVLTSTYLQPPDVVEQTRPAHLEWLKGEVAASRILLAGRLDDQSGAVLITGDISADDAQDIVDRDPYTAAGAARYHRVSFNGAYRAQGL